MAKINFFGQPFNIFSCSVFSGIASILTLNHIQHIGIKKLTKILLLFILCSIGVGITKLHAQEFNDEMKKKLRESLVMPESKPMHHEPQKPVQLLP